MRDDYHKLLTQAGRRKHLAKGGRKSKRYSEDYEDVYPKQGMRYPYRRNGFDFKDHLTPLTRMLDSKVGQNWNDVYSEICKFYKRSDMQGNHVRDHVDMYVYTINKYFRRGDRLYDYRWNRYELSDGSLYVDENGILRSYKQKKREYPEDPAVLKDKSGIHYYRTPHGWFTVEPHPILYVTIWGTPVSALPSTKVLVRKGDMWYFDRIQNMTKDDKWVRGPFKQAHVQEST